MKFETHIDIDTHHRNKKVAQIISEQTLLPISKIKLAMKNGAVWLTSENLNTTKRIRRADKKAQKNDKVHVYYDEQLLTSQPESATLIADEESYSIWYKPYGMLCQGSKWGDHFTINRWVETQTNPQRPAFIVHRLDRAASGVVILAHTKKTAAYFSRLFEERAIKKHYQAIVSGHFPKQLSLNADIDGKRAMTHASLALYDKSSDRSLLNIDIETGRKHQIRKHLSAAGYPIIGDRLHGDSSEQEVDLCLNAFEISFCCPKTQQKNNYRLPSSLCLKLCD